MGSDMLLALGSATVTRNTLFGVNQFGPVGNTVSLRYLPARTHATGERIGHPRVELSEVRQTAAVLGLQPAGSWGLRYGVNRHHLAVGVTTWQSRLAEPGHLDGTDLVRLVLERGSSARQSLDLLTELIERHGQSGPQGDHVFVLADAMEGFVVEAAGKHWALLECQQTRAVCDTGLIRQDWRRLSRGLAEHILAERWWADDGTKVDFQASLGADRPEARPALRRWSRATLGLAQQEGALDPLSLRRLLLEHFDQCLELAPVATAWQGSGVASLGTASAPPIVWVAPGALQAPLFFPLVVGEPLPQVWLEELPVPRRRLARDRGTEGALDQLQGRFDHEADEFIRFCNEGRAAPDELSRRAQEMMTRHAELWADQARNPAPTSAPGRSDQQDLAFITE